MEFFLILVLGGVALFLWQRIGQLEWRMSKQDEVIAVLSNILREREGRLESETASEAVAEPIAAVDPVAADRVELAQEAEPASLETDSPPASDPQPVDAPAPAEPVSYAAYDARQPATQSEDYPQQETPIEYTPESRFSFDFEDIFGRRLPIWGGGFALAIAGIFLVRYSIEAGLVTPLVRVLLSFVFGLGLLGGAEAAYRFEDRVQDPRVRQALAGAGLATLYGAFYLAGTAYGLIGAGTAFVGLALVTAAAIALSFRFGLPCAVIGLIGGFAAPLLVDSDSSNIPLLAFYLALVTGGLAWSGQAQGRNWLGYAALAAGLGWGVLMMFAGVSSDSDLAALGVYLIVLGTVLPAFLYARGGPSLPKLAAGAIATLQMAVLVSNAGFAPLTWGLYLLIGAALTALGWRFPPLRLGTLVAAGLGLWLLIIWPQPETRFFAAIAAAQVVIFACVPLAFHWLGRARLLDMAQISAVVLVMAAALYVRFGSWGEAATEPVLATALAALAAITTIAFALLWKRGEESETHAALLLLVPSAILSFAAGLLLTPAWCAPLVALLVSGMVIALYWQRDARALQLSAWSGAAVTILSLALSPASEPEIARLFGWPEDVNAVRAVLRWSATALPFLAMALIGRSPASRSVGEALAIALIYGVIAQVVPDTPLAWIAAIGGIALLWWQPARLAAWTTALAITALWSLEPLGLWLTAGAEALIGDPFLVQSAISWRDLALRLLPLAAVLSMVVWRTAKDHVMVARYAAIGLGVIGLITLHSVYKQAWDIGSLLRFEHLGMAERSVWQALLVLAAYGASLVPQLKHRSTICLVLIGVSLAHFAYFTLLLHNPLLSVQHVGPTPIANWLTLAFGSAIGAVWLAKAQFEDLTDTARTAVDGVTMILLSLLAYALLRQVFAGSVLTSRAIGETESLLISLLGIVLALAFLWWGSMRELRSWRIGSLVLMLAAVTKVFLIDAAALDGLLRIASFMALGFSLIGIGWVYSRQLSRRSEAVAD